MLLQRLHGQMASRCIRALISVRSHGLCDVMGTDFDTRTETLRDECEKKELRGLRETCTKRFIHLYLPL